MSRNLITCLAVICGIATQAPAATVGVYRDIRNTVPGVTSMIIVPDGEGVDWTGAVFKLDLISGSVYNGAPDSNLPQEGFWGVFPELEWDTWFGVPGDATNGIAGGAGDLGGGPLNVGGTGVDAISITWFNTTTTDTGPVRVANISVSDDATGEWGMIVSFADGQLIQLGGVLVNGWSLMSPAPPPWPEPGTLALFGVGLLPILKRG
ncbi:MAG: hypothetical protein Kow00105_07560 [Phycisphaeraceae bacterium]